MTFVDTSAFYALADANDKNYALASMRFETLLESGEELFTHNYVIVETAALLQRRLGFSVCEKFLHDISLFTLVWIDERIHTEAVTFFESQKKRALSLVDCASFVVMKQKGARRAFAFDEDFAKQGLEVIY